jgi:hypothetical protein
MGTIQKLYYFTIMNKKCVNIIDGDYVDGDSNNNDEDGKICSYFQ